MGYKIKRLKAKKAMRKGIKIIIIKLNELVSHE